MSENRQKTSKTGVFWRFFRVRSNPAMTAVKTHRSVIIEPIFRTVRKELQGFFGKLEKNTQMLQ